METDPFGRSTGDDPLAEMGWTSSQDSPATVRPGAEVADEGTGFQSPATPGARRPRRFGARLASAVTILAFLGIVAAFAVPPIIDAIEAVDDATEPFREAPGRPATPDAPETPATPSEPAAGPARGLERGSLLRRDNLTRALRALRAETDGGELRFVRVDADSVDVQVVTAGDEVQFATADSPTEARVWSTSAATGSLRSFAWNRVDAAAPQRIVRAATIRRDRPAGDFDYAALVNVGPAGGLIWTAANRAGGGTFSANADGTSVRRTG